MSDRLSDEQVAWWVDRPEPNYVTVHEAQRTCTALAREVQELRAEVERLTAENAHRTQAVSLMHAAYQSERALADQLAEALQAQLNDWAWRIGVAPRSPALAVWEAARHE